MFVKLCVTIYKMDVSVTLKDVLVVYSESESDFVRRVVAYVCLREINTNTVQHQLLSTDQEMIPATDAINKHSQDFMVNNELLLPILKAYA